MNAQPYHLYISPKTKFLNFLRKFFIITGLDNSLAGLNRKGRASSIVGRLIPPNYLYPSGSSRNCCISGINYFVDISDTNGHASFFGLIDPAQDKLRDIVKEGMTIYDIGANIGAWTLMFAKKVTASGSVISFEPSPVNFQQANKNISINNFKNILLINEGLGDKRTSSFLYNVNPNNRGMLRFLPDGKCDLYEKEEVQIDTLDNKINAVHLSPPDLIKIDVEGFEFKVLTGAYNTIKKFKPVLFIELDDNNLTEQGSSASELVGFLEALEYKITDARTGDIVNEHSDFSNSHFDILCTNSNPS